MRAIQDREVDWGRRGLRRSHLDSLRRAGFDMYLFEQQSSALVRCARRDLYHRSECSSLRDAELVTEALSAQEITNVRLHETCTRWGSPLDWDVRRWLRPALSAAAAIELLVDLESSVSPDLAVVAGLAAYRPRLEAHLDALVSGLLPSEDEDDDTPALSHPLLSLDAASDIRRRLDALLETLRSTSTTHSVSVAALTLAGALPPRSHRAAAARPGEGAGRVLSPLWQLWTSTLAAGASFETAADAVRAEHAQRLEDRRNAIRLSNSLDLGELLRYWRGVVEALIEDAAEAVIIGVHGAPAGLEPIERMLVGYRSWSLAQAARPGINAVAIVPELVAEWAAVAHPHEVVWFGPADGGGEQLAELVAGLWDGSHDTSCFGPASLLAACSSERP